MKKTHHSSLSKGEVSAAPAAFVIALNCYQGDRYWHYRAASQSIERVRHRLFHKQIQATYPLTNWQAVAIVQEAEDEWAVCLIGHDGVTRLELERFGVFVEGRTYARRYRKQVAQATGLAACEER